jgi:hypothetical protein
MSRWAMLPPIRPSPTIASFMRPLLP